MYNIKKYPITAMQHSFLYNSTCFPNTGVSHIQYVFTLDENINVSAFIKAWKHTIERHPIFRTKLHFLNTINPTQEISEKIDFDPRIINLESLSKHKKEEIYQSHKF